MQTLSLQDRANSIVAAQLGHIEDAELAPAITFEKLTSIHQLTLIETLLESDKDLRELVTKKINDELSDAKQRLAREQTRKAEIANMRSWQTGSANISNALFVNRLNPSDENARKVNKAYSEFNTFFKQQGG